MTATTATRRPGPCGRLTAEQVVRIRERFVAGETLTVLAREFRLNIATISRIVNGRLYAHVGGPVRTHNKPGRRPACTFRRSL